MLLVGAVILANPKLQAPPVNAQFAGGGGPYFDGPIFPFCFICIMCGAISGFHALVSSGTTPKMINKETDIRPIGYGAMLIEGLVGVVALLAAASLPLDLYYDINVSQDRLADPSLQKQLDSLYKEHPGALTAARNPMHRASGDIGHLDVQNADLAEMEQLVGNETLRGRTGGAVTLAVSMSRVLTEAMNKL